MDNITSPYTLCAIEAALKAGEIVKRGFYSHFHITAKKGNHNLVTDYDYLSEEAILTFLTQAFPDHSFLSEEKGALNENPQAVQWIIDPLDGTVNFAHGIPIFSISIAAALNGQTLLGVVYQPMTHELFVAERKKGAYLNGFKLKVSETESLQKSFLVTGFPYDADENPHHCIDSFGQIVKKGIPVRRLGSAALDLAYVATGRFDGFWEAHLQPWDVAAGKLILEEAGGKVTQWDQSPYLFDPKGTFLATNGSIHQEFSSLLKPHMKP